MLEVVTEVTYYAYYSSEYPREGWVGCFGEQGKKGRAKARASGSKSIGKPMECGIGAAGEPETEVVY